MSLPYAAECVGAILFSVLWVHVASYFFVRCLNLTMPDSPTASVATFATAAFVTMHDTVDKLMRAQAVKP